jgi:hypothetical protein
LERGRAPRAKGSRAVAKGRAPGSDLLVENFARISEIATGSATNACQTLKLHAIFRVHITHTHQKSSLPEAEESGS